MINNNPHTQDVIKDSIFFKESLSEKRFFKISSISIYYSAMFSVSHFIISFKDLIQVSLLCYHYLFF